MEIMAYLQIITLAAILLLSGPAEVESKVARTKRQTTFRVIGDGQEFPCEGAKMVEYEAMGVPRVELNDDQKMELYRQLGGEFLSAFMGVADRPSKPYRERGMDKSPWRIGKKVTMKKNPLIVKDPLVGMGAHFQPQGDEPVDEDGGLMSTPTVYEYCNNRTDPTVDPQYLLMCTSCARSTKHSKDVWPQEFYETDCMTSQSHCLYHQGAAYGRCQQTRMFVSVLRKNVGVCVVALADGTEVITEEWILDQIQINIGCECAVNKDSEFR